MQQNIDL